VISGRDAVTHDHVTETDLELFISGRLEGQAFRDLFWQVSRCAECRRKLASYGPVLDEEEPLPPEAPEDDAYDAALDRAFAGVDRHLALRAEEKADFDRLMERAQEHPDDEDLDCFDDDLRESVSDFAWIEAMLASAFELRYRDPHRMAMMTLGLPESVRRLAQREGNRDRYTPGQLNALLTRALLEKANAARLDHLYADARQTLAEALELLEGESLEPSLEGRYLDVEASLWMDQRQLGDALTLLDRLHRHYITVGETHLAGRTLISKGIALHRDERPKEAVAAIREGLDRLDPERDPELYQSAKHNLLNALTDAGEFLEASEFFLQTGLGQAFAEDPLNRLKLRWVEGQIFAGLGKLQRAETIFSDVKVEFIIRDREYLAAMVDLDLAAVLLRQNKVTEAEGVAEEALQIFEDLGVAREALRAVQTLREACRRRVATVGLVQEVISFLKRLENEPGLRFTA
jgi:tetratricopeptide (TPR) repeat protein